MYILAAIFPPTSKGTRKFGIVQPLYYYLPVHSGRIDPIGVLLVPEPANEGDAAGNLISTSTSDCAVMHVPRHTEPAESCVIGVHVQSY
jgi:hypothetical protein